VGGEGFNDWLRERLIEGGGGRKSAEDAGLRKWAPILPGDRVLEVTAGKSNASPPV